MRDLPAALASIGWQATVLTPSYGSFHELSGARKLAAIDVEFAGKTATVDVFDVPGSEPSVQNIVFEHANFSPHGPGKIYCSDKPERPFATDASKFAFFCTVAATWIDALEEVPGIVHLHDWHAAFFCLLREYGKDFGRLREIRTVFTIHNLSYQGIRPISGDPSSLESWFPNLPYSHSTIRDPAYADCFNPMATAIRLTDRVSTVSPSYATEICEPSNTAQGFIGGEGLESELAIAKSDGRLIGILNGCNYDRPMARRPGWRRVLDLASAQVRLWADAAPDKRVHAIAAQRLASFPKRRPLNVLVSVGRLVQQKVRLMFETLPDGRSAIEVILDDLGSAGILVILGSGEAEFEQRMCAIAETADNLLFLCGYSETLAEPLYSAGDLFLMPSSFEPCGISQMLAMRGMQPCVVHGVGGLKDTVVNNRSGFVFAGDTPQQQAANFVATTRRALDMRTSQNDEWQDICIRAASARFSWAESARQTIEHLYADV